MYCALKGVTLPDDVPVVINTLEDVLFMDRINDISFEIGGKLVVLIEHQSTVNPNIALRLLMYIARIYEKIIMGKSLYSTKKSFIPRPEFFVLYNGVDFCPDTQTLKLSDMFKSTDDLWFEKADPVLELQVKVLNINEGRNEAIVKKCGLLTQYSAFVNKVREFEKKGYTREESMKKAIVYCCNNDILKGLLEENSSEVLNMLMTEWNWDDAKQVWFEEGFEEGHEKGIETTARNALAKGFAFDVIQEITGLDIETIKILSNSEGTEQI